MSLDDNIFPQDGDPNDEAFFAQLVSHDQLSDYVAAGLTVSADFSNYEIDITDGLCYIARAESIAGTNDVTMTNVGYAVQVASRTLSIPTTGTNYVSVEPDFNATNTIAVEVRSSEAAVPDDGLIIAIVDSDAGSVEDVNRYVGAEFDVLSPDDILTIPFVQTETDLDTLMTPAEAGLAGPALAYVLDEEMLFTFDPDTEQWSRVSDESRLSTIETNISNNDSDISALQSNKLDVSEYTPESDTHDKYTDASAIDAVDGEVSEAADAVSGLDAQVDTNTGNISSLQSNKADTPHDNTAHSTNYAAASAVFSGNWSDLSGVPSEFTPSNHGNESHSETYLTSGDIDSGAPNPHDNSAHDPDFLKASNHTWSALSGVPTEFTPSTHGNSAHSVNFATASDTFSGNWSDLSGVPDNFNPSTHGNGAHNVSYVTTSGARSAVNSVIDNAATSIQTLDNQVATNTSDISSLESSKADSGSVFSGNWSDLSGVPSDFTPSNHGNESHSQNYITSGDIEGGAPNPHDNSAHEPDFVVEGNEFSGNWSDLSGVPSDFTPSLHGNSAHDSNFLKASNHTWSALSGVPTEFTPSTHGNNAHSVNFATPGDTFSGNWSDLSGVPNNFNPSTHGNGAHNVSFVTAPGARSAVNSVIDNAATNIQNLDDQVATNTSDISSLESSKADSSSVFSGNWSDLSGVPSDFTPSDHGNESHNQNYLTSGDIEGGAPNPHDNNAHDPDFVVQGNEFSGNWSDLSGVPSDFAPSEHDNTAHSVTYVTAPGARSAVNSVIDNAATNIKTLDDQVATNKSDIGSLESGKADKSSLFSGNWTDLSGVPGEFTPSTHGNSKHNNDYLQEANYKPESDTHSKTTSASELTDVSADSDSNAHHAVFEPGDYTPENDTHSKTTSASELTDVSPDSDGDAHHVRYSDEEAQDAVGDIVSGGLNYSDNFSRIVVSRGNALSVSDSGQLKVSESSISHDNISNVDSADHHSKTTSASELTDVSADSNSNAHHAVFEPSDYNPEADTHSKTDSASDLTDVSADSVSDAHHAVFEPADYNPENDTHSKTTSASELTDVSPDSDSNAHHSPPTTPGEVGAAPAEHGNAAHSQTYVESNNGNVTITGDLTVGGEITGGPRHMSFDPGMTEYADTTGDEIYRKEILADEEFVLDQLELQQQGGGSSSSVELVLKGNGTILSSQTLGGIEQGNVTFTDGTLTLEIINNTGGPVDVNPRLTGKRVTTSSGDTVITT